MTDHEPLWGTQTELKVVIVSMFFSIGLGVPLGLLSGYFGGWLDRALVLIMDALLVIPFLMLAIVIAFLLSDRVGQGIFTAAIAITVVYVPLYFRVVRNHTISIREEPFVEAARALGARPFTVIRKYVFFNVIQNVPPLATLNAADAILTLAALGFLGYGIQPTDGAEWGYDINRAVSDAASGIWWTGLFPGLAYRGFLERFAFVPASGHRLPEPWAVGALEQQHLERRRMDDHQHRNRKLVRGHAVKTGRSDAPSTSTMKTVSRAFQYSAAQPRISNAVA